MKQFVIDQMKEYQHRKTTIKAVKYQEGMEDGWVIECERYIEDNAGTAIQVVNKVFKSKDEARKYTASPTDETIRSDFCQYRDIIPVLLREISKDEYEEGDGCCTVTDGISYFDYEELINDCWLTMDETGIVHGYYDTEQFFEDYETPVEKSDVHIGYDRECESLYVDNNNFRVYIDETEVATVEKLLEGFEIPFTEKVGQAFIDKFVMKGDVYAD